MDFEKLRENSYKGVYNYAYKYVKNREEAEDLTQDAFVKAYRFFDKYDSSKSFNNWMLKIVDRLFLDLKLKKSRRLQASAYDFQIIQVTGPIKRAAIGPIGFEEKIIARRLINDILIGLTPHQQQLIIMSDLLEMSYGDIVKKLGKNDNALRAEKFALYKKLKKEYSLV